MDAKIIQDFHNKMTDERLNKHNSYELELKAMYRETLANMTHDYTEYRKHVPHFLSSLESNNSHSISYSLLIFFELYEQIMNSRKFSNFDLSQVDYGSNTDLIKKIETIFDASYIENKELRLSEYNFDISSLSNKDKKEITALIIDSIEKDSEQLNWSNDLVTTTFTQLSFLRQVLGELNNAELFYHTVGLYIDRLVSSEYYQAGRDIVEELILSSYKDEIPELGYLSSFRLYSNIGSIHTSLLYGNLSLTCILKRKPPYSDKFVKEVVWQSLKFLRNVKLFPWAVKLYNQIPVELNFHNYERRSLDHSYFTVQMMMRDPQLPSNLLDYLRKNREDILVGGVQESMPWLLSLYNIKRLYNTADFTVNGLGFFINIFEMIVPPDTVKKYKDIIEGNSPNLKNHLKESLIKLNETRNTSDFVYDNEMAIKISSRLVEYSTKKKDAPGFLLAMMLKSDFSTLFQQKETKETAPLILPEVNINDLDTLYENNDEFLHALPVISNTSMNWLAFSEGKIYQLHLFNDKYSFNEVDEWDYETFKELKRTNYFFDLTFEDTVKEGRTVRQVSFEEFQEEERIIAKKLSIMKLICAEKAEKIYIVKDMELSNYPHNLLLNEKGEFIAKTIPVTNVLSTEWLLQSTGAKQMLKNFSKSIWIPIESGDFALNYLYSNIESTLQENSFEVNHQVKLPEPLSSDINIICSHGAKNISESQIVFQDNNPTYDLNEIIGKGKILIFFVCYSGSMKTEFFRNNITSMIKTFISQGYDSVIAPYWALDVTIPKYWLPEFLNSINEGLTISQATLNANMKVKERYPTPAAWACLHLYGNPDIMINPKTKV